MHNPKTEILEIKTQEEGIELSIRILRREISTVEIRLSRIK